MFYTSIFCTLFNRIQVCRRVEVYLTCQWAGGRVKATSPSQGLMFDMDYNAVKHGGNYFSDLMFTCLSGKEGFGKSQAKVLNLSQQKIKEEIYD